jgi:hypothetical protein
VAFLIWSPSSEKSKRAGLIASPPESRPPPIISGDPNRSTPPSKARDSLMTPATAQTALALGLLISALAGETARAASGDAQWDDRFGPAGILGGAHAMAVSGNEVYIGASDFSTWHTGQPKAPRITQFHLSAQDARISFTTGPGQTYAVESKESLEGDPWSTVTSSVDGDGDSNTLMTPEGEAPSARFYRVATRIPP